MTMQFSKFAITKLKIYQHVWRLNGNDGQA